MGLCPEHFAIGGVDIASFVAFGFGDELGCDGFRGYNSANSGGYCSGVAAWVVTGGGGFTSHVSSVGGDDAFVM